ncbi:NAD(P)-binding protein [Trametopsis cervina]|nr:NAD(P)-binding protein [Trametopsis cervina]
MSPTTYKQVVLVERPPQDGHISDNTFKTEEVSYADLKPGPKEVLYKSIYLSVDPTQRMWINSKATYMPPVEVGAVMRSAGIGIVVQAGEGSVYKAGDAVWGLLNWREYGVLPDTSLEKIEVPPNAELLDFLGPLGPVGMTAYFGITDIAKLKAGETMVVTGAAGATGSFVCQIGKKLGAKIIAIAGSDEKCQWLEKELGVDKALNYKAPTFKEDFIESVGHFDVFFDNVGGSILNLALTRMALRARIVLCGAIADYNGKPTGITAYTSLISQRASMTGFLVSDYRSQYNVARVEIGKWVKEKSIKRQFHVLEGIESCSQALPLLFSGANTGKLVVKLAEPDSVAKL